MAKKNKVLADAIKSSHTMIKNYKYEKGTVNLSFSLNIKSKVEMQNFVELMDEATKEVKNDIINLNQ